MLWFFLSCQDIHLTENLLAKKISTYTTLPQALKLYTVLLLCYVIQRLMRNFIFIFKICKCFKAKICPSCLLIFFWMQCLCTFKIIQVSAYFEEDRARRCIGIFTFYPHAISRSLKKTFTTYYSSIQLRLQKRFYSNVYIYFLMTQMLQFPSHRGRNERLPI